MTTASLQTDSRSAAVTLLLLALILYGSLFPFEFSTLGAPAQIFTAFLSTAHDPVDRADILSNVLLYFPLGFFAARIFPNRSALFRIAAVTFAGASLSTAIELAQTYDAGRAPSVFDASSNAAGALLGAATGTCLRRISGALLLVASWFASRLIPFVPSLAIHKYRAALRALLAAPQPMDVLRSFAFWLAAALLIDRIAEPRHRRRALILSIGFVLAARIVIVKTAPSSSEAMGAIAAAIVWIVPLARIERPAGVVCAVLVLFLTLDALAPFYDFSIEPDRFSWIPFRGLMEGPRESGSRLLLENTFVYGALLWLLNRAGSRLRTATLAAFVFLLLLNLAQTADPFRRAGITGPLMVLVLGGLLALLPEAD